MKSSRGWLLGLIALALQAGCEDGSLPLGRSDLKATASSAAHALLLDSCVDPTDRRVLVADMLGAINAERARRDLPPLRLSADLNQIADFYACRLIEGAFFSHKDPFEGSTVAVRAVNFGYAFWKIGENLAAGQPTVQAAMAELMASPRHRANILDPAFTEVGLAVKLGGELGIYWVQEFGRPASESPDELEMSATEAATGEAAGAPASQPGTSARDVPDQPGK